MLQVATSEQVLKAVHPGFVKISPVVGRQYLSIDVHECHGYSEENRGALLEEEDVPYAQARLQRQ